nr:MAG TPA: hypothetical protein [Caudoviricetes sp.]
MLKARAVERSAALYFFLSGREKFSRLYERW